MSNMVANADSLSGWDDEVEMSAGMILEQAASEMRDRPRHQHWRTS